MASLTLAPALGAPQTFDDIMDSVMFQAPFGEAVVAHTMRVLLECVRLNGAEVLAPRPHPAKATPRRPPRQSRCNPAPLRRSLCSRPKVIVDR